MNERRIVVWVQHFADRPTLMLQWHDPATGKRKSKSAETCNPVEAEKRRADLEYELNHGLHHEPSRMTWETFRGLFEGEFLPPRREGTRKLYRETLDTFEELCHPRYVGTINERTVSAFDAALFKRKTYGDKTMQASTIKVRLQYLRTVLGWAARQKIIPARPDFPRVRVPKKKPQAVAVEAFDRLLAKAADPMTRAYLLCAWLAGLRLNEALTLRWEENDRCPWVDLGRDRVVLPAEFVKGVEDQWVPIDPELRQALEALPRQGDEVFTFVNRFGRRLNGDAMSHRVRRLARAAGVKMSMKTLRRGFGCRYAGKVSAQVLQ